MYTQSYSIILLNFNLKTCESLKNFTNNQYENLSV